MRIIIAGSEAVPYAKTGGLADVAGALLKEFRLRKEKVSIFLPLYSVIKKNFRLFPTGKSVRVTTPDLTLAGDIFASDKTDQPAAYFIDNEGLFNRPELYGTPVGDYPDNSLRFIFFSRAVLEACKALNIRPDIIHCNDWQTAMIPLYLKGLYKDIKNFSRTASIFTVHNLGYQGLFDPADLKYTGLGPEYYTPETLEFYGRLNLMKAGLIYSDLVTTVSETYAQEILEPENGFGLDGLMRKRKNDLYGILNGIDYDEWDSAKDRLIPQKFSAENLRGKAKCRKALIEAAGFDDETLPAVGIVSRLSFQKGLDLVSESLDALVSMGVNLAVLGRGEANYQNAFTSASERYRGRIFAKIGFEERLAHLIYAGSDFFLMPSRYEPCGLGQLIAMRYGAVPIARKTGGLADTVQDYNPVDHSGTGFLFSDYSPSALQYAVQRAKGIFHENPVMNRLRTAAMRADFSWKVSAEKYMELYRKALKKDRQ